MAGTYGRGSAASASRAQAGDSGSAYQYAASAADKYLQTEERSALSSATEMAGRPDRTGSKKRRNRQADKRATAAEQVGRLREVASTRALDDFNAAGLQHSKPWLQKASQGLIASTGEVDADAAYGAQTTAYGSVGVEAARETRGKLSQLAGVTTGVDRNLFGSAAVRNQASKQSRGQYQTTHQFTEREKNVAEMSGADVSDTVVDYGVTSVVDAARAYTGISGGTNTVYDNDPTTTTAGKRKKKNNSINSIMPGPGGLSFR